MLTRLRWLKPNGNGLKVPSGLNVADYQGLFNERINVISTPITTSIFDLFNVGPGTSSSHTIGPMKAAFDFWQRLAQLPESVQTRANDIHTYLYG